MSKYKIDKVVYDRWAVWYKEFDKQDGKKIGVYKIIDLYSGTRKSRIAIRYLPRKGQTQEQSDTAIINNTIHFFYKSRNVFRGNGNLNRA